MHRIIKNRKILQIFFVALNVKIILKNIISCGLSLLLMTTIVHIDYHVDEHQDGYSICDINCIDHSHHSIDHQCQKCLNKNQKLYPVIEIDFSINQKTTEYYNTKNIIYVKSIIFDLHSRPPPSLI
jgi:hypothetical protein